MREAKVSSQREIFDCSLGSGDRIYDGTWHPNRWDTGMKRADNATRFCLITAYLDCHGKGNFVQQACLQILTNRRKV